MVSKPLELEAMKTQVYLTVSIKSSAPFFVRKVVKKWKKREDV